MGDSSSDSREAGTKERNEADDTGTSPTRTEADLRRYAYETEVSDQNNKYGSLTTIEAWKIFVGNKLSVPNGNQSLWEIFACFGFLQRYFAIANDITYDRETGLSYRMPTNRNGSFKLWLLGMMNVCMISYHMEGDYFSVWKFRNPRSVSDLNFINRLRTINLANDEKFNSYMKDYKRYMTSFFNMDEDIYSFILARILAGRRDWIDQGSLS